MLVRAEVEAEFKSQGESGSCASKNDGLVSDVGDCITKMMGKVVMMGEYHSKM